MVERIVLRPPLYRSLILSYIVLSGMTPTYVLERRGYNKCGEKRRDNIFLKSQPNVRCCWFLEDVGPSALFHLLAWVSLKKGQHVVLLAVGGAACAWWPWHWMNRGKDRLGNNGFNIPKKPVASNTWPALEALLYLSYRTHFSWVSSCVLDQFYSLLYGLVHHLLLWSPS